MERDFALHQLSFLQAQYLEALAQRYGPPTSGWIRQPSVDSRDGSPITDVGRKPHVRILISNASLNEPNLDAAKFELSHEAFHLLAPGGWPATVLEEGLAVKTSLELPLYESARFVAHWQSWAEVDGHYGLAYRLVEAALKGAPPDAIGRLRTTEQNFGKMSAALISQHLDIAFNAAERLLKPCIEHGDWQRD